MLGIVTPPVLQMFVQSHIITQFFNKINPYFEKNLIYFLWAKFEAKRACQVLFFSVKNRCGENGERAKN